MDDELKHYGIGGMKWGRRRYQNEDGTYTEEGKERRRIGKERLERAFYPSVKQGKDKPNASPAGTIVKELGNITDRSRDIYGRHAKEKTENLSKVSDAELRARVNRLQLERQYNDLRSRDINSGRNRVLDYLDTVGDVLAYTSSAIIIYAMILKIKNGDLS